MDEHEQTQRRAAARRTAIGLIVVAIVVYGLFVLSGVFGQ